MRIHIMGRHAHRTPFAYEPYKRLFRQRFDYVDTPEKADVILFGYVLNIDENAEELARLVKANPALRLVVVSEEPLWDTTNSGDFRKRHNIRKTGDHAFAFSAINHHTSKVYEFRSLPYFLTTEDEYYLRYAYEFGRNAAMAPGAFAEIWKQAGIRYAFFAENRDLVKKYSIAHPDIETYGLSVYRTDVAKAMPDKGTMRVGQGWGAKVTRQELPDWHLDKLLTLQGKSYIVSAIENTSQRNYISEKIFDAYACRGLPLIWAPASHRIHEFAPAGSCLNLFELSPADAAKKITGFKPTAATFEAYAEAQAGLYERFRKFDDFLDERIGFYERLSDELTAIVEEKPAPLP
ncbi:glycosyltransferase family 10 domain-containing protein [Salipiger abyssi]|uniref:Glycosyltransferase family 10 (Fucosyltransferase) C-term n=1 Tax=Salipiger abyssi TaxID=1250539 RepID=A0A1P8V0N8_9RHOB|nr:glycosyltransferase family 10 [Salipiger abyssi]APZ55185.1 Glycosyltransferase family 10 (fucosyltransferase) C-term [Salipiger abyssi]